MKIMTPKNYLSLKRISTHNGTGSTSDIVSTFKEQQPMYITPELDKLKYLNGIRLSITYLKHLSSN